MRGVSDHVIDRLRRQMVEVMMHACARPGTTPALGRIVRREERVVEVVIPHLEHLALAHDRLSALELFKGHIHAGRPQRAERGVETVLRDHGLDIAELAPGKLEQR